VGEPLNPFEEPAVPPPAQPAGEPPAPPGVRHPQNYVDIDPLPGGGR
jgi:hypothetical protein